MLVHLVTAGRREICEEAPLDPELLGDSSTTGDAWMIPPRVAVNPSVRIRTGLFRVPADLSLATLPSERSARGHMHVSIEAARRLLRHR